MTADEGYLSRWSRRKRDERERAPKPADEVDEAADAPESGEQPAEIAPEDLPDIDTLHKDSDFTVFMRDGVPEELKRRALRKLWTSDPVLANVDGLNDYDGDYATLLEKGAEAMRRFAATGDQTGRPAAVTAAEEIDAGPAVADDASGSVPESGSESAEDITESSRATESSGADEEESAGDDPTERA